MESKTASLKKEVVFILRRLKCLTYNIFNGILSIANSDFCAYFTKEKGME